MTTHNTLTSLIPDIYVALDVVSRELIGMIPAVGRDVSANRVAIGASVRSFRTRAAIASDVTPAQLPPDDGGQTLDNNTLAITKMRRVPVVWTGDEELSLAPSFSAAQIRVDQFAQAFRTLANEMEGDLTGLHIYASRAYGTAGTTPFASDLSDTANVRKILDDNGCPLTDRALVIDTTAGAKIRTLTQLTKANEAASTMTLRDGELLNVHGFSFHESAQVKEAVAVGTAAGATTNAAGYPVGTTSLTLAVAGTGTLVAGDVITFAGDTNKYLVVTGDADVSNGGTLVIANPGLRVAMSAATKAITVVAAAARNIAFTRSAIQLATRLPALPQGGDMATDRQTVVDARSGIAFEIAMYPGYRQMQYEVAVAWGVAAPKPEHIAVLLG